MRILIKQMQPGAASGVHVTSPITVRWGDRELQIGVGRRPVPKGETEEVPAIWVIYAWGTGSPGGRIYLSAEEWKTFNDAANAMGNGFEVADPSSRTEEGKLVANLLRQGVAERA